MCTKFYQFLINIFQAFNRNYFSFKLTAYIVVLAIYTVEIASRKKDRSGTLAAADDRFFPMMQSGPCHHWLFRCVTDTRQHFYGSKNSPFDIAFAGAYFTQIIHKILLVTLHPLPDDRVDHKVFKFFAIFDSGFAIRTKTKGFQIFRKEYFFASRTTQTASGIFRIFKFQRFFTHQITPDIFLHQ